MAIVRAKMNVRIWRMLLALVRVLSLQVGVSSFMIPEWRFTNAIMIAKLYYL